MLIMRHRHRPPLPLGLTAAASCMALPTLAIGLWIKSSRHFSTHRHEAAATLADLLPMDLDDLDHNNEAVMRSLSVQLLRFGGYTMDAGGAWHRSQPIENLSARVARITPTWKPGGHLDYSWSSEDGVFSRSWAVPHSVSSRTVQEVIKSVEAIGLRADDFDAPARAALTHMMTWRVPMPPKEEQLVTDSVVSLLVLSFDATPDCRSVVDCPRPGPTNELLAATAARFIEERRRLHGQRVDVIAQWEVAAALATRGVPGVRAVGTPGVFENTAEIFALMQGVLSELGCSGNLGAARRQIIVLAHPDHLPRAVRIGETVLFGGGGRAATPYSATTTRDCTSDPLPPLLPAMQPYALDWPWAAHDARRSSGGGRRAPRPPGAGLDLFAGVSALVHTEGEQREAGWDSPNMGYFPDGEPQRWAHKREVFIAYEAWARAKGVATGIIKSSGV